MKLTNAKETIKLAAITTLIVGRKYVNRNLEVVTIDRQLGEGDKDYTTGWRFHDTAGMGYTDDGRFSIDGESPNEFDLIGMLPEDFIETIETMTTVVKVPGLFSRIGAKIMRNKVKTAAGVGVAGVAGVGGYNYYNTGSPLGNYRPGNDDIRDATAAFVSFLVR